MFFSGFCLENEDELFEKYIIKNDYTVCGFSFGCQKAIQYVQNAKHRIDKIQLFSPSYFDDKNEKFKRLQMLYFEKDSVKYCKDFLGNCAYPEGFKKLEKYFKMQTKDELRQLLYFDWSVNMRKIDKNIKIEIFLGEDDKIISSKNALEFFRHFGQTYYIKNKGHTL